MIHRKIHSLSDSTLRRVTSYASVGVAVTLIVAKLVAYVFTGSVALLSSLVDSSVDLLASLITAFGVAHALRPADHNHRYGHGKAESLAALAQSAFIVGSSVLLSLEAINRFVKPREIENPEAGYLVMGMAIVLTLALLLLQSYTVRRTNSMAIASDRLHYVGDVAINAAVIATFAFQQWFKFPWIDPLFAMLIAGSMGYSAVQIGCKALDVLMDSELPEEDRTAIIALACAVPGVKGVHDLRTRTDSDHPIIEMHVEMAPDLSLREAHDIAEAVMKTVEAKYHGADILIHEDPDGVEEKKLDAVIAQHHPKKK